MNVKLCAISILSMTVIAASMGSAMAQNQPLAKSADQVLGQAQPVHVQARIVGIDPATRTLMVHGPDGDAAVLAQLSLFAPESHRFSPFPDRPAVVSS